MISVKDVSKDNLEDVFKICSHSRMDDPVQQKGMALKRKWLLKMLNEYGSCSKIAYLGEKPVAQALYYPEEIVPFIPKPRRGAMEIHCVYNPFPEARGKGAASAILKRIIEECKVKQFNFIFSNPFQTAEGLPMKRLYLNAGFERVNGEMVLKLNEKYTPFTQVGYESMESDQGKAICFYEPICEWAYGFAEKVAGYIKELAPGLLVELIDKWEHPKESIRGGNNWLIVNTVPIISFFTDKDVFKAEILKALKKEALRLTF